MARVKEVRGFDGGIVVETKHEVLALVGFEDPDDTVYLDNVNEALTSCLETLKKGRCPLCGEKRAVEKRRASS